MIKVDIYDTITPLLQQMIGRTRGLAQESLQVAGAHVAREARSSMNKMGHHWFNDVINGQYTIWSDENAMKILGKRISHSRGGGLNPSSMDSLIGFYLAPKSLTVVIGGAHPRFRPIAYKDGLPNGYYGKTLSAVGSKGRAILHKLNTGEITSEHPYAGGKTPIPGAIYEKDRNFMEKGYSLAKGAIERSLTDRFEKSFRVAVNRVDVDGIRRKYG